MLAGTYVYVPLAATVTVPYEGAVLDVTVRPEPPSFARTDAPARVTFAVVVPVLFTAWGVIVNVTVAADD